MPKLRLIVLVAIVLMLGEGVLGLFALALRLHLLPERRQAHADAAQVSAFWHDDEALVFVSYRLIARRSSLVGERAPLWLRARLLRLDAGVEELALGTNVVAWHVEAGRLRRFDLANTPLYLDWGFEEDRIRARARFPGDPSLGFRWNGADFTRVSEHASAPSGAQRDEQPEEVKASGGHWISNAARVKLEAAGWRSAGLNVSDAVRDSVEIPMDLRGGACRLVVSGSPRDGTQSVKLVRAAVPSPEVLFAGGSRGAMARREFDQLPVQAGVPAVSTRDVFGALTPFACAMLAGWLGWKGSTRGLKITFLAFVVVWSLAYAMYTGSPASLLTAAIPVALGFLSMVVLVRFFRHRLKRTMTPVDETACPAYARTRLAELTRELQELGFRAVADRQTVWRLMAEDRRSFVRVFRHDGGLVWAELQANDDPRTVGRLFASFRGDTQLLTCDLQANQEVLPTASTLTQRVPRSMPCREMLAAHEALAAKTPGASRTVDDPLSADAEAYEKWVADLMSSGQVVADGEWFQIAYRAAIPVALRVVRGFLQ